MISSSQAILILSHVAGASILKIEARPRSDLAVLMASLIAKNAEAERNRAGSPIPLEE